MESELLRTVSLFGELAAFNIPLTRTIKNYLDYLESTRNASINTIKTYGGRLLRFVRFCQCHGIDKIEQIKPENIFAFFAEQKRQGKASSTIRVTFEAIKMLVKYAALEGIRSDSFMLIFCIQVPKVDTKLPRVLTVEQVERIIEAEPPLRYNFYYRDKAILELLYATGIRGSELVNMKLCDVSEDFILIFGKGKKERMIPIIESVKLAIQDYIDHDRRFQIKSNKSKGYLFLSRSGRPLYRHDLWRIVKKYARFAGLKDVSPHTLRHCFATHLFMNGAELLMIQKALGHSSISTTQIYTHVNIEQLKKTIKKYHPRA